MIVQRPLAHGGDRRESGVEDIGRREHRQAFVRAVVVVGDEAAHPLARLLGVLETAGVIGRVFEGFEVTFTEGVVVASRADASRCVPPPWCRAAREAVGRYRRAAVLMHDQ
jgi:hypothetical protein